MKGKTEGFPVFAPRKISVLSRGLLVQRVPQVILAFYHPKRKDAVVLRTAKIRGLSVISGQLAVDSYQLSVISRTVILSPGVPPVSMPLQFCSIIRG